MEEVASVLNTRVQNVVLCTRAEETIGATMKSIEDGKVMSLNIFVTYMKNMFISKLVLLYKQTLQSTNYMSTISRGVIVAEKTNPVGTLHNIAQGL